MNTKAISLFFEKKDFESIAQILEQASVMKINLNPDLFVEIYAIASFTYINLEKYDKSLVYSSELLNHFFAMDKPYEDRELIDNLVKIKYTSLCALGARGKAYDFIKQAISKLGRVDERLEFEFDKERERRIGKIVKFASYSLSVVSFLLVIFQYFFKLMHSILFIVLGSLLMFALFLLLKEKGVFWKLLSRMV